jgi:decaprenylphospho-beta-D-ribofuranose 2-oxidase
MTAGYPERELSGWGRFPVARSRVARPDQMAALPGLVGAEPAVIARGLGRSYGDAAIASSGVTLMTERLNRFLDFDPEKGIVRCEAGVTIEDLLRHLLPRGFFPPVTPGTKYVTLGGALACDVHGKSHHKDGSFSRHVTQFTLLTASGELVPCSREKNADLFWATMGGMGLTGIFTDVSFRMQPVESGFVRVDYERAPNLDRALELFETTDQQYTHSVAWIDCLKRGGSMGRSILMRGNWAARSDLPARIQSHALDMNGKGALNVPFDAPRLLLNPLGIRVFNSLFYHRHRTRRGMLVSYEPFFYPLDRIGHWNRLYGRRGFLQYQCLLPHGTAREGIIRLLELLTREGHASFLAVLKRFGDHDPRQLLSFPRPGYTLAVDLPRDGDRQDQLLRALDDVVLKAGGRVYLAKDARMDAASFRAMYPEWPRWLEIKRRVDPEHRFSSVLARRLELLG